MPLFLLGLSGGGLAGFGIGGGIGGIGNIVKWAGGALAIYFIGKFTGFIK